MDGVSFFVGCLCGAITAVLIACVSDTFVNRNTLERNGYCVIKHHETHGAFHTNWVEIVRTDGRSL